MYIWHGCNAIKARQENLYKAYLPADLLLIHRIMIQTYFKLAIRSLSKNRLFTVVNIAGLSLGMAAGLLMLLWTQDELSFDAFHADSRHIYRENAHFESGGASQAWAETPAPHALYALQEIPEVEKAVRVTGDWEAPVFGYRDKRFVEKKGGFADSSFFEVFRTEMLSGNPARPFPARNSIVLTESFARKYFGDSDPLGKILEIGKEKGEVSAVIRDFPGNSIFHPGAFRSRRDPHRRRFPPGSPGFAGL